MTPIHDTADLVSKALRRAWQLGQTYWQQADSEYQSHWKKADATQATFDQLVEDTRAAILTSNSGAQPAPSAEWFNWLPPGTTHISRIRAVAVPCFGFEATFNAFKYIDGVLYTYRTDSDNEYGEWVKADSRYRNGVLPAVYPLSGAQEEEK